MIEIRPATPQDSLAIASIQVDSYRTAYAPILPAKYLDHFTVAEQEQEWQDWFRANTGQILYVAVTESGELAGYALGKRYPDELPPYDSELVALHVRRNAQQQGIGQRLVAAIARALKDQGCTSLFLWVLEGNPARLFYENLGGRTVTAKPWENNSDFGTHIYEVAYGWPDIQGLLKDAHWSDQ